MKRLLATSALAGLMAAALAGISSAQIAPIPIEGTNLTIYDPGVAANANEIASNIRAAIRACNRDAYDAEIEILQNLAAPYALRSGIRIPTDPFVHDGEALLELRFLYLYPEPCTPRSGLALSAGLTYSRLALGSGFGVGTLEAGIDYRYGAATSDSINRLGFEVGGQYRLDGDGFLGGRRWLIGGFAYATSSDYAEGGGTVGVDGITTVALTNLFDALPFGTGVSSSFAGDSLEAFAQSGYSWSATHFGYEEAVRPAGGDANDGSAADDRHSSPKIHVSVAFSYETFRQEHYGEAAIVRAGVDLAVQAIDAWAIDNFIGVRFGAGYTIPLGNDIKLQLGGYVTPYYHRGVAEIVQTTTLGVSDTQTLGYEDRGFAFAGGIRASVVWSPTRDLDLSLDLEYSVLSDVTQANPAVSPALGFPATITSGTVNRIFVGLGFGYDF